MVFNILGRMSAISPHLTMVLVYVCDRGLLHMLELFRGL